MLETIQKTREYLDFLEKHYNYIQKAFKVVEETCKNMRFIYDDFYYHGLRDNLKFHDVEKLSNEEFIYFREWYFPTEEEQNSRKLRLLAQQNLEKALKHHRGVTNHHANHISKSIFDEIFYAEMVIDWIAVSYFKGGTAKEFYESYKKDFKFEDWVDTFITDILNNVYEDSNEKTEEVSTKPPEKGLLTQYGVIRDIIINQDVDFTCKKLGTSNFKHAISDMIEETGCDIIEYVTNGYPCSIFYSDFSYLFPGESDKEKYFEPQLTLNSSSIVGAVDYKINKEFYYLKNNKILDRYINKNDYYEHAIDIIKSYISIEKTPKGECKIFYSIFAIIPLLVEYRKHKIMFSNGTLTNDFTKPLPGGLIFNKKNK